MHVLLKLSICEDRRRGNLLILFDSFCKDENMKKVVPNKCLLYLSLLSSLVLLEIASALRITPSLSSELESIVR